MEEISKIFNKINSTISVVFVTLNTIFGTEWVLFAGYLILNILDYVTGVGKARIKKVENSNKGMLGIIKKVCYWILIGVSFLISYLLMELGSKLNINFDFIIFFGWFTLACLIINEARSIIENLTEIGLKVPKFLKSGLKVYQEILNKTIDNEINKDSK